MKVGVIRCQQTEDICGGTNCFKVALEGKNALEEVGPSEMIAFVSCGGCPGKRVINRVSNMVERGVEVVALASCITKGNPIGFPCPHADQIKSALVKKFGDEIKIVDYTH